MIHDSHDASIDRSFNRIKRETRFLPSNEKHLFADTCAHRVHGDERPPRWFSFGREWLNDEQLESGEVLVFSRDHDVANHSRDLHLAARYSGLATRGLITAR